MACHQLPATQRSGTWTWAIGAHCLRWLKALWYFPLSCGQLLWQLWWNSLFSPYILCHLPNVLVTNFWSKFHGFCGLFYRLANVFLIWHWFRAFKVAPLSLPISRSLRLMPGLVFVKKEKQENKKQNLHEKNMFIRIIWISTEGLNQYVPTCLFVFLLPNDFDTNNIKNRKNIWNRTSSRAANKQSKCQ